MFNTLPQSARRGILLHMPSRTIDGTTFHYLEKGTGKPLVLVHGFPLDSRIWQQQIDALSNQYRVIAPDLRGFGQSGPASAMSIDSLAEDLHRLLESIGALPCALAGLSMGGYIAFAFHRKFPRAVQALILVDTRAQADTTEAKAGRNKMIELVREKGSKAIAEQMMPKMFTARTIQGDTLRTQELRQIMESCPPRTIEQALAALRDRDDFSCNMPSIAEPTLIIVGEQDAITPPAMAQAMHENIPRSQLVTIPGAGHVSSMEKPDEVTRAIREFLDRSYNQPGN